MLCGMCLLPAEKFSTEDPSLKCANCMIFYHRRCTFLNRLKNVQVPDPWLCNHCRRNRMNKISKNYKTPYFFKVATTVITDPLKLLENSVAGNRIRFYIRTRKTNYYCRRVEELAEPFKKQPTQTGLHPFFTCNLDHIKPFAIRF